MTGVHDFNGVTCDDVFVPDNMRVGEVGYADSGTATATATSKWVPPGIGVSLRQRRPARCR